MENKQFWTMVVIAVVVALVVSLVVVKWVGPVLLSPLLPVQGVNGGGGGQIVNANECTRDDICEVNNLLAQGAEIGNLGVLGILSTTDLESNVDLNIRSNFGDILLDPSEGGGIRIGGIEGLTTLYTDYIKTVNANRPLYIGTSEGENILVGNITLLAGSDNDVIITNLKSAAGNGYVCVDGNGTLFRSQTPCI